MNRLGTKPEVPVFVLVGQGYMKSVKLQAFGRSDKPEKTGMYCAFGRRRLGDTQKVRLTLQVIAFEGWRCRVVDSVRNPGLLKFKVVNTVIQAHGVTLPVEQAAMYS